MLKTLILILVFVVPALSALAQTEEKPKAYLLDEFSPKGRVEVKSRTKKLRKKLQELARTEKPEGAYLMFFYDAKKKSSFNIEKLVRDTLFDNCYDCFGYDAPRIVFVNIRDAKEQKVQFWLVPEGSEPPQPENKD
jgi:hypothetical protein